MHIFAALSKAIKKDWTCPEAALFRQEQGFSLVLVSSLAFSVMVGVQPANSQPIIPDNTLPVNTRVTPDGTVFTIEDGTVRGVNLFHSFQEFSIPTGGEAFFNNALEIETIFSRVTGTNISDIDGLIRANGAANLFLLNPNGVIFGLNARLDIGGSFLASTANSFKFPDGSEFSAVNPEAPPLLTINVTPGLQWGTSQPEATITNRGNLATGQDLTLFADKLNLLGQLQAQRDLTLLAQDTVKVWNTVTKPFLAQSGGNLTVQGNAGNGGSILVETPNTGQVRIMNEAVISTTSKDKRAAGDITINTGKLIISDGSRLSTASFGDGKAGNIDIYASDSIELIGTGFQDLQSNVVFPGITGNLTLDGLLKNSTGLIAGAGSNGDAGNINLETGQLIVRDGALIFTSTFSQGKGGNLDIAALQRVELSGSLLGSVTINSGAAAGDITIDTKNLIMQGGALVSTSTYIGSGQGGVIKVNASESVELGGNLVGLFPTTITSASVLGTGNSGDVSIQTQRLSVRDGAEISTISGSDNLPIGGKLGGPAGNLFVSAELVEVSGQSSRLASSSFTSNPAGNITVSANTLNLSGANGGLFAETTGAGDAGSLQLQPYSGGNDLQVNFVQPGAQISASTSGSGTGGNLRVTAPNSITLSGDGQLSAEATQGGNAGNLDISANQLTLTGNSSATVNSQGGGTSGNLTVTADSVTLNRGQLTADTQGGGANIQLNIGEFLLMRNESLISANARGDANGGNITIKLNSDTGFLIALPSEGDNGSDIVAKAEAGDGGNINLSAQQIFGIQARPAINGNRTNDIDASSEFGAQGQVEITTLAIDPSGGLTELPTQLADSSRQIVGRCSANGMGSEFTITGRGGLPPSADDALGSNYVLADLGSVVNGEANGETGETGDTTTNPAKQIIEAQGWVKLADGTVVLTANPPTVTSQMSGQVVDYCQNLLGNYSRFQVDEVQP